MIRWEVIHQSPNGEIPKTITDRMEVTGGHIIRTRVHGAGNHVQAPASVAMVFVPTTDASIYDAPPGGDPTSPQLSS